MPEQSRYRPLKSLSQGGILLMRDIQADSNEEEEIVELSVGGGTTAAEAETTVEADAEAPSAFEFSLPNY